MFLMRGLPGSGMSRGILDNFLIIITCLGKSTIVNILKTIYSKSVVVCSADNYFIDSQGVYQFNRSKLGEAHRTCQQQVEHACK